MGKIQYQLEFPINSSTKVLFHRLSTLEGLLLWFADDVHQEGNTFTFTWGKNSQQAQLYHKKENQYVKFHWLGDEKKTYFEFRIEIRDITGDVALILTDFAEEKEIQEATELWRHLISKLRKALGA